MGKSTMATSTHRKTTANGITVKTLASQASTSARRVAAALPQGAEAIDRICPGVGSTVELWCAPPAEGVQKIPIPDGYHIVDVCHFESGNVCVDVEADR